MKYILSMIFVFISNVSFAKNIYIKNCISFTPINGIKIINHDEYIRSQAGKYLSDKMKKLKKISKYYLVKYYMCEYKNHKFSFGIFLKVNDNIGLQKLKTLTNIKKVINYGSFFGMGDAHWTMISYSTNHRTLTIRKTKFKKHLSNWGTEYTSDILLYYFKMKHKIFSEALIQILNVYNYSGNQLQ